MELYVTRREFESALKELNKLQTFLVDTFGAKFVDYCRQKDIIDENDHSAGNNDDDASVVVLDHEQCSEMEMTPLITNVRGGVAPPINPGPTIVTVPALVPIVTVTNSNSVPVPRPHTSNYVSMRHRAPSVRFTLPPVTISRVNSTSAPTSYLPERDPLSDPPIPSFMVHHHQDQLQHQQSPFPPSRPPPPPPPPPPPVNLNMNAVASAATSGSNRMPLTFYLQPQPVTVNNPAPIIVPRPGPACTKNRGDSTATSGVGSGGGENANQNGPASKRPRTTTTTTTERLPSFRNKRSFSLTNSKPPSPQKVPEVTSTTSTSTPTNENEIIQCDTCQLFIYASQIEAHQKNHELMDSKVSRSKVKVNSNSTKKSKSKSDSSEKRKQKRNQDKLFQQPHTCPLCQVVCVDFQTYEDHCLETHPDGKPCPLCRKLLLRKTNLKRHMVIHRNLRFICDICGKGYGRSDNLVAHKKGHQEGEVMSIFFCGQCGSAFSSKHGRDKHLRDLHNVEPTALITVAGSVGGHENDLEEEEVNEDQESSDDPEILDSSIVVETIKVDGDAADLEFEYEGDDE